MKMNEGGNRVRRIRIRIRTDKGEEKEVEKEE